MRQRIIFYSACVFGILLIILIAFRGISVLGQVAEVNPDTTIVALGDSITRGAGATGGNNFVDILSKRIGLNIINEGISGATTASALARLESDVLIHDPDIVIIFLGGNDILQGVPQAQTFENLRQIVNRVQASGARVIIMGLHRAVFNVDYESGFRTLAAETGAAYVPNVLSRILGNPSLMSNAIHPNDAGHLLIADRVFPILQSTVNSLPDQDPHDQDSDQDPTDEIEPSLTGWCSVRVTPLSARSTDDFIIVWNSRVIGTPATSSYQWSGTDGLTGSTPSVTKTYTSDGLKEGNVNIFSGGRSLNFTCSALVDRSNIEPTVRPLGGSCAPNVSNMIVNWNTSVVGGLPVQLTYIWSGTDGLTGSTTSSVVHHIYTTEGIKDARVEIRSGNQSLVLNCEAKVASTTPTSSGGCFIATAAYGNEMEPEVETLRNWRDEKLLQNKMGEMFVDGYYKISPPIANFIRNKEPLKATVRVALKPIIWSIENIEQKNY